MRLIEKLLEVICDVPLPPFVRRRKLYISYIATGLRLYSRESRVVY